MSNNAAYAKVVKSKLSFKGGKSVIKSAKSTASKMLLLSNTKLDQLIAFYSENQRNNRLKNQ
jgi:hypothetical protein